MLSGLREAVEDLEVPLHGDAIGELFQLIDRLQAQAAVAVGEYAAKGLFALDGAVSMTGWAKQHAGMSGTDAAAMLRRARRVQQRPVTRDAWLRGDLSGAQVSAITGCV